MTSDVWLGALLSIPIGVGTGLAVVPIERWRERHGKKKGLAKSKRMREEYAQALEYVEHPHAFTQFLLRELISIVRILGVVVLGTGLTLAGMIIVHTHGYLTPKTWFAYSAFLAYIAIGAPTVILLLVMLTRRTEGLASLWYRVRYFDEYQDKVLPALKKLDEGLLS